MERSDAIAKHLEPRLLALGFASTAGEAKATGYWAFQRGDLKIALALDPRNGELGISLNDLQSKRTVEFWLFGQFVDDREVGQMGSILLRHDRSEEVIGQLAEAIERHSDLLGDWSDGLAERLFAHQAEISAFAWRKQKLNNALKLADECWRSRDYARFVRLLEPFENELSPATLKKVQYAHRTS